MTSLDTGIVRVLVIACDRRFADVLRRHLMSWGCEVQLAADGEEGIEAARSFRPAMLVWDLGPRHLDVHDMASVLRVRAALDGVFAIALTGMTWEDDTDHGAKALRFDLRLPKPMALDVLRLALADAAPEPRKGSA